MRRTRRILIALAIVAALLWWISPGRGPSLEPGSILVLNLSGSYVEAAEPPLLARMLGDQRQTFVSLLSELRKAERDERLAAVVLRIRNLEIGWGKAAELRDAIADLGKAGRRTVAYLELMSTGGNLEYYVASAAGEIRSSPSTATPLVGLAAQYLFLGGLWEKLGAGLETEGVGEYKSATETIAGRQMSGPFREMANSLLDSVNAQFIEGIASGRNLSRDAVRAAIDAAPSSPGELQSFALIDGVAHYDELIDELGDAPVIEEDDYARVDPSSVGFAPVARFALIYGSGLVAMGSGSSSPSGGLRMTSDTLGAALEDAAEDSEISAIVLRIDSPGGSPLAADILWRGVELARRSKPVVVSVSDLAASGGYYVACGADAIVASPASLVGSIGVFVMRPYLGGLLEKLGIGVETLARGEHADLLFFDQKLDADTRARLRSEIEAIYALFVERVSNGRKLDPERVEVVARGRVWTGVQAQERGLVDALGGLRVAVQRAKQAAKIDADADVELVPYPSPKTLAEQIDTIFRRISLETETQLPLPRFANRLAEWLAEAPTGAPALVPPVLVDIR